ncbi:MAG: methyltransferase [Clostridia bacterium]|nr:methyltransferase [Clostridia bacterium]
MTDKAAFTELILTAMRREVLKKLVFSKPLSPDGPRKISARLCAHRGRRLLAVECSLEGNTVSQKNLTEDAVVQGLDEYLDGFGQINLLTTVGDAEYKRSAKGKEIILGKEALTRKLTGELPSFVTAVEALEKKKSYLLTGAEPFLTVLGISDKNGRVHDKMQGKFRQIHRFLEQIGEIYEELPAQGALHIYDLCCGKSYLSFAVYHYLTALRGREVDMLCMDLKADVIRYCAGCAEELGYRGIHFVAGDITALPSTDTPDMVMSLHACDVATDIVLNTAVRLGARVILSTPCCHRYLTDKLKAPALAFVSAYPHLKNKLCETLTDALRLARLRAAGYHVCARELTDPENTPKNTLLRAVKVGDGREEDAAAYRAMLTFLLEDGAQDYLKDVL